MSAKSSQITVSSDNQHGFRMPKFTPQRLGLLGVAVILVALGCFLLFHHRATPSQKLESTVTDLQKNGTCTDGLKQVSAMHSNLSSAAQETRLRYLMNCSFLTGNNSQTWAYANQLDQLYAREGQTQKRQDLAQMVNYMKSFH